MGLSPLMQGKTHANVHPSWSLTVQTNTLVGTTFACWDHMGKICGTSPNLTNSKMLRAMLYMSRHRCSQFLSYARESHTVHIQLDVEPTQIELSRYLPLKLIKQNPFFGVSIQLNLKQGDIYGCCPMALSKPLLNHQQLSIMGSSCCNGFHHLI